MDLFKLPLALSKFKRGKRKMDCFVGQGLLGVTQGWRVAAITPEKGRNDAGEWPQR